MDAAPTIERRIRAAMALAGLDEHGLADRIATNGYSYRTIQRMLDPRYTDRVPEPRDLPLIAKACRVSESFWTEDFATLGEANHVDLAERVETLEHRMATVLEQLRVRLVRGAGAHAVDSQREHPATPVDPPKTGR